MNVLVIGAAGKTGQQVVEQALAAGHAVTALVHNTENYHAPAGVRVVAGDAADASFVGQAINGQQAIVDTLGGHMPFLTTHLEENAAKAVVKAMQQHGVRRLVAVSVMGAGDSRGHGNFLYEHLLLPILLHGALPDKNAMEQAVTQSGLDYVLVRPPMLTDDPATGQLHVITGDEQAHQITRADLASFIVQQLTSHEHLGKAVVVANS